MWWALLWIIGAAAAAHPPTLLPPNGVPSLDRFRCRGRIMLAVNGSAYAPTEGERFYCWCRQDNSHRFLRSIADDGWECVFNTNGHYRTERSHDAELVLDTRIAFDWT